MAIGDITILDQSVMAGNGAHEYLVAAGTTALILPGEPVMKFLGGSYTAATLSFVAATSTINDSAAGFVTAGFLPGETFFVNGSTLNNGTYTIVSVTATDIVVTQTLVNELAGAAITMVVGAGYVVPAKTNQPVVGTDYWVGIAATTSTETLTTDGKVNVNIIIPGVVYLMKPLDPLLFDTQAEYDALVGSRVLVDLTAGTYKLLAADGATFGCVIEALDVFKNPGKVAFSIRQAVSYLA